MNYKILSKCSALALLLSLFTTKVNAQEEFTELLEASQRDANSLVNGYINPFLEAFSTGLGSSWMNTAKAHKSAGFDLTVTANAVYIPDDELFYSGTYENLTLMPSASGSERAPTVFGTNNDSDIPSYNYNYTTEEGQQFEGTFDAPEGINLKDEIGIQAIPVPMAQLGIGIIKKTDIKIRWTPTIDVGDNGEFKLIGFGIMHDIKQHIPKLNNLPFDLSAFVGFTDMSLEYDLAAETDESDNVNTENGTAVFDVNTWSIQGMISKKFSVLTLYGGLGYNISKASLAMKGDYTITDDNGDSDVRINPISLTSSTNGPRLTAGFRLKLAIITLHTDYTLQKYNTLSVGVGFSVR